MEGKFIVIEGGDGAGKDTQIDLLKQELGEDDFLFIRDPGGTDVGEKLREILLFNESVQRRAESLIYLAARSQLMEEQIQPALEKGRHVISHRFDLSTLAYQVYGRDRREQLETMKQISDFAIGGRKPDLLIYLECPADVGIKRVQETREEVDRFEKEHIAFHERVREGYAKHLGDYNHVVVDSTRPVGDVFAEVHGVIQKFVA